jgi:hypothetical protein
LVEQSRPPGAASATGASCECGDAIAKLASRLARVEDPLAALERVGRRLLNLPAEFDPLGTERVERTVAIEVAHRTERYLAGRDAYRHPIAAIAPLHR